MGKLGFLRVVCVVLWVACCASADDTTWKVFSNNSGWKISYPATWTVASCVQCDPAAENVFVNLFPPEVTEPDGSVIIEPMANKPAQTSVDDWLGALPTAGNRNFLRSTTRFTLNGLPALKVRYLTPSGDDRESVYVVAGLETFKIEFSSERPHTPLRYLVNYPIYLRMLDTFQVSR